MAPATGEQRVLLESTVLTVALAAAALAIGVLADSGALVFDGLFSVVEVGMSLLALLAARLVVRESNRRFQFGYWHIEPITMGFNGGALILLCLYGFVDALGSLLAGGNEVAHR